MTVIRPFPIDELADRAPRSHSRAVHTMYSGRGAPDVTEAPDLVILYWDPAKRPTPRPTIVLTNGGDAHSAGPATVTPSAVADVLRQITGRLDGASPATPAAPARERFGEIEVAPAPRTVTRAGVPVELTATEFDLVLALVRRRGDVATREALLREVWGARRRVPTRTVDTHICSLRRKLEPDVRAPRHILTVWGVGYKLQG